jgi:hypothetical protein
MEVQAMTLQQATSPKAVTMMSFIRERGQVGAMRQVHEWLKHADLLSGGKTPPEVLAMLSSMVVEKMRHRSVASVLMALRDGLSYTDDEGKVYGSLNWPKIALWLDRHEEKVMALAHETHASKVVKGDNYGSDWLNTQEAKSTKVQDRKDRLIDSLRKQLDKK